MVSAAWNVIGEPVSASPTFLYGAMASWAHDATSAPTNTTTPSDTREAASRAPGFTEASPWESRSSGTFAPSGRSPSRGYLMKA